MRRKVLSRTWPTAILLAAAIPLHAQVDVPNEFSAGNTARASEVNANFNTLETGVNEALSQLNSLNRIASSGDAAADGQALRDAVESVGTGDDPVFIQLAAGTYDVGDSTLEVTGPVVIAGAGRTATTITGQPPGGDYRFPNGGSMLHVSGGGTLEIRNLTLDALSRSEEAVSNYAAALSVRGSGSSALVDNVRATLEIAETGSGSPIAYTFYASEASTLHIVNSRADLPVDNSAITSNDALMGVAADAGSAGGSTVEVIASEVAGVQSGGSGTTVHLRGSAVGAASSGNAVRAVNNGTLKIATSRIDGAATDEGGGGTLACVHTYDTSYAALGTACQ
ncbi:hypothetical protein H0Z60_17385 [Ectothiorhodospiraceae bacterium WFHF3C12]|nr:hypothetical protein [Ectothiorhodospiraceae bacterium WFHF3C12]